MTVFGDMLLPTVSLGSLLVLSLHPTFSPTPMSHQFGSTRPLQVTLEILTPKSKINQYAFPTCPPLLAQGPQQPKRLGNWFH